MKIARMRLNKAFLMELGLAIAVGLGFLLLSYSRLAGDTMSIAFQNVVHRSAFAGQFWGTALAGNLLLFGFILVTLHVGLAGLCWVMARLSAFSYPNVKATPLQWLTLWCCLLFFTVLVANAALYPNSSLGNPYAARVLASWAGINFFGVVTGLAAIAIVATLAKAALRRHRTHPRLPKQVAVAVAAVAVIAGAAAIPASHSTAAPSDKPHVIIIGIDSLRHDETQPGGPTNAANVARFLAGGISFNDATTPLARTFPSWVSILTGRNPHTTGAIINLLPRKLIHTGDTLGDLFRRAGYHTVYSIDETRFSNIDASYGFDETITPPIGASDFLIGWFGDTPLSNLLVNTRVGAVLFPHLYANRGASKLYDPDVHLQRLEARLDFDRPTFLAMHLTLAHWPFIWRDSVDARGVVARRKIAVEEVDRQFAATLSLLERRGALKNALVIVLSDHGESLGNKEDSLLSDVPVAGRIYDEHKSPQGHGTDVLSPQQYQVVLGFRCFGKCPIDVPAAKAVASPVSLEDLAPTLQELFSLDSKDSFDGRSLRPLLASQAGAEDGFRGRVRFTESEFNPIGLVGSGGDVSASAAAAASEFYAIDPVTDRIEVRERMLGEILSERQYAAFDDDTLLAALPEPGKKYRLIAVRRDKSEATLLATAPDASSHPEFLPLYQKMTSRYGFLQSAALDSDAK